LNQIDHAAYQKRAGMVKMEPWLWQEEIGSDNWRRLCSKVELRPETDTIQPPRTIHIDLRESEEEILARMKQKTRYNIRLSARKGVTVRQAEPADLPNFVNLMQTTGERNEFEVHEPIYYKAAFELFAPDHCAMLLAEYEGQPLAGVMAFAFQNQGLYLFGGSSNQERQRMPAYAAQWAAIQWCKERGCTYYDLWGVPDAPEDELEACFQEREDGLWGVYRHKRGYGGEVRRTVGSVDRIYNNRLYRLYQWRRRRAEAAVVEVEAAS
jgi:lipid II:glycine glycyltransferase (peptidoglycan interpeptide bridge formation enzyme)